jgi:hypothetical protein
MKSVFIRAIEAPVDQKAAAILAGVKGASSSRFDLDVSTFAQVPRSPFAYWVGDALRSVFANPQSLAFDAKCGMGTLDDFRFLRVTWEGCQEDRRHTWQLFAKGGAFSPYYSDIYLLVNWSDDAVELKTFVEAKVGSASRKIQATSYYFRPGLTWPLRTNGLSFRVMPRGCIFSHKGPAAFCDGDLSDELLSLCAILNSSPFGALVAVHLARTELAQSFEVGLIQQTPVPELDDRVVDVLAKRARRSWSLKRRLDTRTETSHAFLLPAVLQVDADHLVDRAQAWGIVTSRIQAELEALAAEIDESAYKLYGISAEDRRRIEQGFGDSGESDEVPDEDNDTGDQVAEVDAAPMVASLLSWSVGAAFGRFDVRLATGERVLPSEPEPFDALPVCSPGRLTSGDGLALVAAPPNYPLAFPADGVLVDDPGHSRDLLSAVRSVFDTIFEDANARWHEAAELLGAQDLRTWFAREFFQLHIKRYSRSRRKAPIYWQLATASGSYSVWIYIHRATADTMFRVLNELVGPKLEHERAKLATLARDTEPDPSATQRKELDQQEGFVDELQALKAEIERIAPLWRPNLDDGVILNFAPLWRLVPQSRSWQSECLKAWDKLVGGEYDWAHLAMHLWPERVVPKCLDDRSLAIAHGLEDVFWHEDESGTWHQREVGEATVAKLIAERTSSTVKAALKNLLAAPVPSANNGRKAKPRRAARRRSAPKVADTPHTTAGTLDEAMLEAVRDAIASLPEGASKAEVVAATGFSDADWNKAIAVLVERGDAIRTGKKRGTRYHSGKDGRA